MTLTTLLIVNIVLGAAIVYGLHHLLAHGISAARSDHREPVAESPVAEPQRRAA